MTDEPNYTVKAQMNAEIKSMADTIKFRPEECLDYSPRITVSCRPKTAQELEIEELAKKYNL